MGRIGAGVWDIRIWKLLLNWTQQDVRVTHSSSRIFNSWLNNDFSPQLLNNKNPTHSSIHYFGCVLMPACCQHTNKEQSCKHTAIQVWIMSWICIRSSMPRVSAIVNHFICKPHNSGRKQLPVKWYPSVSTWKISSSPFPLWNTLWLAEKWHAAMCFVSHRLSINCMFLQKV